MRLKPCIPNDLAEYKVRYEYKTSVYNITVKNISKTGGMAVKNFKVNGEEIIEKQVKLMDNGRIYEVEVEV